MANTAASSYGKPVTTAGLQQGFDLGLVNGWNGFAHAAILVKDSCTVKEQITKWMGQPHRVPEKTISHVVAANLKYWMDQAELTQTTLATKAGVSQKTVSNYLNPAQRVESGSGKAPSPKLEELDKIAKALAVPLWQLVRQMSVKERKLYDTIERAYSELTATEVRPK